MFLRTLGAGQQAVNICSKQTDDCLHIQQTLSSVFVSTISWGKYMALRLNSYLLYVEITDESSETQPKQ